jgi:lipopolysaccharide export system protein LptC
MIHRANRLFPVVLVIIMALMTLWLDQISRLGSFGRDLDPAKPEYVSEQVTATRFDSQGHIQQRLIADRLWQFPHQHDLFFNNGFLQAFQQQTLDYTVNAQTGHFNTQSKQAFFDQRVHLRKPAGAQQPETTLDTSAMSLDTVKRYASSQMPVAVHYGNSTVNSTGFNYDYNTGVVNLLSFARATYEK